MKSSGSFEFTTAFKNIFYIACGVLLLFATSQISIPLQPIPITLQTVGIMLIGLIFTRNNATAIVGLYLALGAIGVPIFANQRGGLHALFGPSGGYLWGFLVAVMIMSTLKKYLDSHNLFLIFANCIVGTLVILMCGVAWLAFKIGYSAAMVKGFYPFLAPGLIKVVLATLLYKYVIRVGK